jgi:hypothetical protein
MRGVYARAMALSQIYGWDASYRGLDQEWRGKVESIVHEMAHAQLLGRPLAPSRRLLGKGARRLTIGELIYDMDDGAADRHEALALATERYALRALGMVAIPMRDLVSNANFRQTQAPRHDMYHEALEDPRARRAAAAIVQRFERAPA